MRWTRFRRFCVASALASAVLSFAGRAGAGNSSTITNIAQVRLLTPAESGQARPVDVHGVVIGEADAGGVGFALQDDTAGLYFKTTSNLVATLKPGDFVRARGVTDPGEFGPFVLLTNLERLGEKALPAPRAVSFEQMESGSLDAQWVEVSGVVRFCEPDPQNPQKTRLELATGGQRLTVRWNVPCPTAPLTDAEARLRGVCYYEVNSERQALAPLLAIPHDIPIVIERPAPAGPFAAPVRTVNSLFQFSPTNNSGHRVRLRGVVTCQRPGGLLWIYDGHAGIGVRARQTDKLAVGDIVDVLGFPVHGPIRPMLEDAVFRRLGPGAPPPATPLRGAADAFAHDATLVQASGWLEEVHPGAEGLSLTLQEDGQMFHALLDTPPEQPAPTAWAKGSRVRVTGICSVAQPEGAPETGLWQPQSFQILMRTADDLQVIEAPPWWTGERLVWPLAGLVALSLAALAAIMFLTRWRLREQAARRALAEREFSAILAERNRMAREIHDTLAQGLGAISMQLELAKSDLAEDKSNTRGHLEQAHALVRHSLTDARDAIWNMRSQVLETGDLSSALDGILRQMTQGSSVTPDLKIEGTARRLPPVTENALLRIGQEAITNAVKHAQARQIQLTLSFEGDAVRLSVKDDGRGFDPSQPAPRSKAFGLLGMTERAAQIHGELQICSEPGRGASVTVAVPAPM